MKLYLHYEAAGQPNHTLAWTAQSKASTLEDALNAFCDSYASKHGVVLQPEGLELRDADGDRISLSARVDEGGVRTGDDIDVKELPPDTKNRFSSRGPVPAPATTSPPRSPAAPSAKATSGGGNKVRDWLAAAEIAAEARNFRRAMDIWRQVLQLEPKNVPALRGMGGVFLENARHREEFYADALVVFQGCIAAGSESAQDWLSLGRCQARLGSLAEALTSLRRARLLAAGNSSSGKGSSASSTSTSTKKGRSNGKTSLVDDVDAEIGWTTLATGEAQEAANVFHAVLERTQMTHVRSLEGYCGLAMASGQVSAAIAPVLKAIVAKQKDKEVGRILAELVSTREGMDELLQEHTPTPETAPIFAFLATEVRDHGALEAAAELLGHALRCDPKNALYALNLAHVHENLHDLDSAVATAAAFYAANPKMTVGSGGSGPSNAEVLEVVSTVLTAKQLQAASRTGAGSSSTRAAEQKRALWRVRLVSADGSGGSAAAAAAAHVYVTPLAWGAACARCGCGSTAGSAVEQNPCDSTSLAGAATADAGRIGGGGGLCACADGGAEELPRAKLEEYATASLDLLALHFTVVKVLHLQGHLHVLPSLIRLIEPARRRSKTPLHQTNIRNEQAYYTCITHLLAIRQGAGASIADLALTPPRALGDSMTNWGASNGGSSSSGDSSSSSGSSGGGSSSGSSGGGSSSGGGGGRSNGSSGKGASSRGASNGGSSSGGGGGSRSSGGGSSSSGGSSSGGSSSGGSSSGGSSSGSGGSSSGGGHNGGGSHGAAAVKKEALSDATANGTSEPTAAGVSARASGIRSWDVNAGGSFAEPIYVCGDSHTLPTAWAELHTPGPRITVGETESSAGETANSTEISGSSSETVEISGGISAEASFRRWLLVPALVTGLKHWHLRPASDFYPKAHFKAVTSAIPTGAAVVFVFGEIDCREGLLVAVERARYDSLEEAAACTAQHFVAAATALVKGKNLRAFVHPIVPVLDETRPVVIVYNRILRRLVEAAQGLTWLDFFDSMLTADGKRLRPELALDGTHLNPSYLKLLEGALCRSGLGT